tara:strand:- start:1938 stop:2594 length:657 start_codon:yes stop_codon:yes gene_type:complete
MERLVVLDTETTGLDVDDGHKIIEIGCVEILGRTITSNFYHQYINPKRQIDEKAFEVHGISNEQLRNEPSFDEIIENFIEYISNSTLIIHNAPFDMAFLKAEYESAHHSQGELVNNRKVIDTLKLARKNSPGKRNTLDALCSRFFVDNTERNLHGALMDAELLAQVYLKMTQGQTDIAGLNEAEKKPNPESMNILSNRTQRIIEASEEDMHKHTNYFK